MDGDAAKIMVNNNKPSFSTQKSLTVNRDRTSRDTGFNQFNERPASSKLFHSSNEEKLKTNDIELKASPRKPVVQHKMKQVGIRPKKPVAVRANSSSVSERPCQNHSFITDATDVRQMEQGLLSLLDDFNSGKLKAFDCSYEKMEKIREQQEKLAKLHFELGAQQDILGSQPEGKAVARQNFAKLIENLEHLSNSIEQLHSTNDPDSTDAG